MKQFEGMINKQLKDPHVLSKYYGLFAIYLILKYTGNIFPQIIDQSLPLCLHNYNTDIRLDKAVYYLIYMFF